MQLKTETTVGLFIIAALAAFFYLTFQIGVFRFDKMRYASYIAFFKDASNVSPKGHVKIAGVKVGWIEKINLVPNGSEVRVELMILKDFKLHANSRAILRQEGILGPKYIEIIPGDPETPILSRGGTLAREGRASVSIDDLLHTFKAIANNVEEVSASMRDVFVSSDGSIRLKETLQYFGQAAQKIATISESFERLVSSNETNMGSIMSDVRDVMHELKQKMPSMIGDLAQLVEKFNSDFLPKITNQVSDGISQAKDSFKEIQEVVGKINDGQGLLGKIINEDETYNDIRGTVRSIKNSFDKLDRLSIALDMHFESMYGMAEKFDFQDAKGYANFRITPCEDYFYLAGLAFSQRGYVYREIANFEYFDEKNRPILPSELLCSGQLCNLVARSEVTREFRDSFALNLQVGKIFDNFAFRLGLFEGSAGIAFDFRVPFVDNFFNWISTFEAYDFKGRNRIFKDDRPHLKWLNRVFVSPNIYLAFGADDFISRYNKNAFFGAGIRFCDDDLKYVLGRAMACW